MITLIIGLIIFTLLIKFATWRVEVMRARVEVDPEYKAKLKARLDRWTHWLN